MFGFHFNTGSRGIFRYFQQHFQGSRIFLLMIFPPLCLTRVRVPGPGGPWGSWAGPHCHRIPGIQGMPNAWLNQEFNEFLWPRNKGSWATAPALGQRMSSTGAAQFSSSERDPSVMLCFRSNQRGCWNFKGKVPSLWDLAAAEQPSAGLAGTHQYTGASSGSRGRALGKLCCWWKENPCYRQRRVLVVRLRTPTGKHQWGRSPQPPTETLNKTPP